MTVTDTAVTRTKKLLVRSQSAVTRFLACVWLRYYRAEQEAQEDRSQRHE